jgi:predicted restriction endonuclease
LSSILPVFEQPEIGQGVLTGTILKRKDIIPVYIDALLEHNISEEAKSALRAAHPNKSFKIEDQPAARKDQSRGKAKPDTEEQANDLAPPREEYKVSRVIRNTTMAKEIKELHDFRCQVCGIRRERGSSGYAEAHHIQPLGAENPGPDVGENILVVCPNHHADFDYGMLEVNPETLQIRHAYDDDVDGTKLRTIPQHDVDPAYLEYHNENV